MIERQIRMTISSFPSLKFIVITTLLKVTAYTTNTTKNVDKNSQMRVIPGSESVKEPIVKRGRRQAGTTSKSQLR